MLRTHSFLIKDLNTAKLQDGFVQKGMKFFEVHQCGAITNIHVETLKSSSKKMIVLTINDPSGSIDCIYDPPPQKQPDPLMEQDIRDLKKEDPNDPMMAFCLANQTPKKTLGENDFKVGMWVKINGRLQQQNNVNFITIDRLSILDNLQQRISYFEDLRRLYNTIYNKT